MSCDDALRELAATSARAAADALDGVCPGTATHGEPAVAAEPARALERPGPVGFASSVTHGGDGGGTVFELSLPAARRLAAVMMGAVPETAGDDAGAAAPGRLTDSEEAALGDALEGLITAAGTATLAGLGDGSDGLAGLRVGPASGAEIEDLLARAAHATTTEFQVCGEPARLVQLYPGAAVERLGGGAGDATAGQVSAVGQSLRATTVRVSAEIGRTRLPVERIVGVPAGTILELDRDADDPIDLYVNGRRFAVGRLELTATGEWAVRDERILEP